MFICSFILLTNQLTVWGGSVKWVTQSLESSTCLTLIYLEYHKTETQATTEWNLKNNMLVEEATCKGPYLVWFHFSEMPRKVNVDRPKADLQWPWDGGIGNGSKWVQGIILVWQKFWVGSKIKLVWWLNNCKFTKSPCKVHLKLVNCMVCKLHFNKAALKKKITYKSKESSYIPKGKAVTSEKHVYRLPEGSWAAGPQLPLCSGVSREHFKSALLGIAADWTAQKHALLFCYFDRFTAHQLDCMLLDGRSMC